MSQSRHINLVRAFFLPLAVFLSLGIGRVAPDAAVGQGDSGVGSEAKHPAASSPVMPLPEKAEHCLNQTCFETRRILTGQEFYLRGVANRDFLWAKVYSIALYQSPSASGNDRGIPEGAKLLVMEYHRSVEKQKIIDSIIENVDINPDVEIEEVRERFNRLTLAFDPPKEGVRYEFLYIPGEGTSLIRDENIRVTIPGEDFAFAFFGIWLSPNTGDQARRIQLLGERA